MSSLLVYAAEDNADDQRILRREFAKAGASEQLELFDDGQPLIDRLASGNIPDCVLLDMGLPDVDGYQVMEFLDQQGLSQLPVFVLVSSPVQEELLRKRGCAPTAFLAKPTRHADVCAAMAAI